MTNPEKYTDLTPEGRYVLTGEQMLEFYRHEEIIKALKEKHRREIKQLEFRLAECSKASTRFEHLYNDQIDNQERPMRLCQIAEKAANKLHRLIGDYGNDNLKKAAQDIMDQYDHTRYLVRNIDEAATDIDTTMAKLEVIGF